MDICGGCGRSTAYAEEKISALGKSWHPSCFTCASCDTPLEEEFSVINGSPYHSACAQKLQQSSAQKCAHCSESIVGKCLNVLSKRWHTNCLLCVYCHNPFDDGQMALDDDQPFHPKCLQEGETFSKCFGCKQLCEGEVLTALEMNWHPQCFKCNGCGQQLGGSYATSKAKVYHQNCVQSTSEALCHGCKKPLGSGGDAIEAIGHEYHKSCFKCAFCSEMIGSKYTTDINTAVYHPLCLEEKRRIDKENRRIVMSERVRIWTDLKLGKKYTPPTLDPSFTTLTSIPFDVSNSLVTDKQLREEFKKYDVDGSGLLDEDEFVEVYKAFEDFGLPRTDMEVKAILDRYRRGDSNGKVSYNEFCILMLRLSKM